MTDPTTTVDTYIAMWNEADAEPRAQHIARAWAADGRYADPAFEASRHRALNEMVGGAQAQFPGHRIVRTTAVDAHHDQVRFGWELTAPDGTVAVAGIDAGELDTEGRFTRIVGYFGDLVPEGDGRHRVLGGLTGGCRRGPVPAGTVGPWPMRTPSTSRSAGGSCA